MSLKHTLLTGLRGILGRGDLYFEIAELLF